jgi:hypothetical protein
MLISCDARESSTRCLRSRGGSARTPRPRRYRFVDIGDQISLSVGFREASASRSAMMRQPRGRARLRGASIFSNRASINPGSAECSSAFRLGATYCASSANIRARNSTGFVLLSAIRAIPVLGSHRSAANLAMTSRVRFIGRTELASASTLARLGSATGHDGSAPNLLYFSPNFRDKSGRNVDRICN